MRNAALLLLALASTSCATAVPPRVAAPLMPGTLVVGGTASVTVGQEQDIDVSNSFITAGGGAFFAAPVLVRERLQLEVDGSLLGGVNTGLGGGVYLGSSSGLRAWYALDDNRAWWVGVDGNMAVFIEALNERGRRRFLQAEFRPMLAFEPTEFVWVGVRPGVVVPWASGDPVPFIDLPLSLAVQTRVARVGVEAGLQGPYFIPATATRIGVVVALTL